MEDILFLKMVSFLLITFKFRISSYMILIQKIKFNQQNWLSTISVFLGVSPNCAKTYFLIIFGLLIVKCVHSLACRLAQSSPSSIHIIQRDQNFTCFALQYCALHQAVLAATCMALLSKITFCCLYQSFSLRESDRSPTSKCK